MRSEQKGVETWMKTARPPPVTTHPPIRTYREERLGGKVRVVALSLRLGGPQHLQPHELESLVLKTGDNGGDEATLHAIGLDGNESAFL